MSIYLHLRTHRKSFSIYFYHGHRDTEKIIKILIDRLKVIKITINTEKFNLFTHTNASEKFFDLFYHGRRDTEKIIKILIARLKEIKYTGKKC